MIPAATSWLTDPAARAVCDAVSGAGHAIYFVGGCVRNALLTLPDSDVDLATNALPEEVIACTEAAGLKAVPTGIDHGTITVISNGSPFEVTTFRKDVETDGRRAVVAFSDNIEDDARRRDFTMNALYATPEGKLVDPLGGYADLMARRVRFIDDAQARVREDYLRILRFFRFSAWYANPYEGFDADTLAAIATNLVGLETLSAERVGQEMTKLLAAPDPAPAVATMAQIGVLHLLLPGSDPRNLAPLVHVEQQTGATPDWITRLAVIGGTDARDRLRLSNADARRLDLLREQGFAAAPLAEVAYRHGEDAAKRVMLLRAVMAETLPAHGQETLIAQASKARFPVAATDLMPDLKGPALGAKLKKLEQRWIDSGFALTRKDLLDSV